MDNTTTILLIVSRLEFINKVISSIELLECDNNNTNLLCIVDGDNELYVKARNLIMGSKYKNRLTIKFNGGKTASRYNIKERRQRITDIHNYAKTLIEHDDGYIFLIEDDTTFGPLALKKLLKIADSNRAFGLAEGVELGRWGVPYVGGWVLDDIYDPEFIISVDNQIPIIDPTITNSSIDAGGLYCCLIKTFLYKSNVFFCHNGLGPDINLGINLRQQGFENYIAWDVPCWHHYIEKGELKVINPKEPSTIVTMIKQDEKKWKTVY